MTRKHLTTVDIHGTDPLAVIAFKRFNLRPIGAALFFLFAGVIYAGILPRFWGYPLEVDGVNLLNILLVFPVAGYFYAYQPRSILRTYESTTRYLHEEEQGHTIHFDKIIRTHASKLTWIVGALFGLLGAGLGVSYSIQHIGEFWYSANWFQIILVHSIRFLAFYCIGVSAGRHLAASVELNNLFEHAEFPLTLDSDRLEVFRGIRNFALEFVGVAAIIALNLGLQPLLIDPPILEYSIYVGLYFIIAPFSFFLPIWEVHRRMVRIKDEMLDRLHYDFQEESQKLYREIRVNKKATYVKKSETMLQLEKTIEVVSKTLAWPFEGSTIYRLIATVVSPFVLLVFEIFINITSGLLVRF